MIGADVNLFVWQSANGANTALASAQAGTFIYAGRSGRSRAESFSRGDGLARAR